MFKYSMSGLDNVWLENGYTLTETPYGPAVHIEDPDGLDAAIAMSLVKKEGALGGKEVKFIRQLLGLSQKDAGRFVGVDAQTVARWEKGECQIGGAADKMIRLCYLAHASGDTTVTAAIEAVNFMDRAANGKFILTRHAEPAEWESTQSEAIPA
ncbi:hypothetical protein VI06_20705 [Aquitalea magnusonii]|nr:hypothetical protein VI06_20705 [Aquitalea magnusonii]